MASLLTQSLKRDLRDLLSKELGDPLPDADVLKPAVKIHTSVKADYIVCLEDGTRHRNLTMHLNRIGMTPGEYKARWGLPCDYPMLAPNYSLARDKAWRERVRAARAAKKREATDAR
ncbi:MAG: MucR family transcriptional regulator [Sphingomonadales bacterium]|nr:MucR family transcriptional regulator [Sphingomonadales bacterium]